MSKPARPRPALPRIQLAEYPTPEDYAPFQDRLQCLKTAEASEDPCPRCPGYCCQLLLSLTVHDVARICVGLTVQPEEFCHLEARDDGWSSPPVEVEGGLKYLLLNSGGIRDDASTQPCVFLHTLTRQRRCSIYELRPMTCRLYPFRWQQGDLLSGPRVIWCPLEWLVSPASKRRVVRTIKQSLIEEAESAEVVRAFNRQRKIPHTQQDFFRHAIEQGARLLGLDPTAALTPPTRKKLGQRLW